MTSGGDGSGAPPASQLIRHRYLALDGLTLFYREAGAPEAPAVLLLHGFPSSSRQFRHFLLALADRYRVLAPDFPAFGFSACPDHRQYRYSFENYTDTIEHF